jgi:hypothetical protein
MRALLLAAPVFVMLVIAIAFAEANGIAPSMAVTLQNMRGFELDLRNPPAAASAATHDPIMQAAKSPRN